MKRNPRKIKRNPPMKPELPTKNLGGFLPNPTNDCERRDMWVMFNGMPWIDLSICHSCESKKICAVRIAYLFLLKQGGKK